jgi:3',5'-nucleoside bisphosphate phosphatase
MAQESLFADLHMHTCFSDGNFTPEELAAHGKRHGLAAMALTDHDTVEGCARMAAACEKEGIEFITGTELTAEQEGVELHLLGYCVDVENEMLLSESARFQKVRQNRIHEMVAKLNELNVPLRAEAVFAIANCRSPGRPHVARALVQAGLCRSLDEAFERFLKVGRPGWVPKCKISAGDGIRLIQQAGGVAVMAHPGLNKSDELIPKMAGQGLDGIECFHTKHSAATSRHYLKLAEEFHLLVTGGSDCHGTNKGKALIGTVKLPYIYVEKLKQRAAEIRTQLSKAQAPRPAAN